MYTLAYHPHVVQHDIPKLGDAMRRRVRNAIRNKLTVDPIAFTKPLRHSLQKCRALRVGDYRVVIIVQHHEIRIVAIVHRSKDYRGVDERLE